MRTLSAFTRSAVTACLLLATAAPALAIDAVKGKQYKLTPKHGPWMIMVTSFRDVKDADRKTDGLSAQEAADELVYELRQKGIPAYTFAQDGVIGKVDTINRLNQPDQRIYAAQRDMICVLAGNYDTNQPREQKTADETLRYIKSYFPKFMKSETKSGAIFRQGAKGPLSGAFLTINPLVKPEEVAQQTKNSDVAKLNSGIDHALASLKKPYTVKVATFSGRSVTPLGNSMFAGNEKRFDDKLAGTRGQDVYDLSRAGEDAAQLTQALRARGMEAYVYHDLFQSVVTVGGFDKPDDPRIRQIVMNLGAKMKTDASGKEGMAAEVLTIPLNDGRTQAFVFDPQPKVIAVPRLK